MSRPDNYQDASRSRILSIDIPSLVLEKAANLVAAATLRQGSRRLKAERADREVDAAADDVVGRAMGVRTGARPKTTAAAATSRPNTRARARSASALAREEPPAGWGGRLRPRGDAAR